MWKGVIIEGRDYSQVLTLLGQTALQEARDLLQHAINEDQMQEVLDSFELCLDGIPADATTEREIAHGGIGFALTKLGKPDLAQLHLNKCLPFDLTKHSSTKPLIAQQMMTRIALDLQAYTLKTSKSRELTLACLPSKLLDLQLSRLDGRSNTTPDFRETLAGLHDIQASLEFVKETDMEFLLSSTRSVTSLCNAVQLEGHMVSTDRCIFLLQRHAWYRPRASFSFLTGTILSKSMKADLMKINPFLTGKQITQIETLTVAALFRANRASWINLCLAQVRKSIALINDSLEMLLISKGIDAPDARLACLSTKYQWVSADRGHNTAEGDTAGALLPLNWLRSKEAEFSDMCADMQIDEFTTNMVLRYCGYDPQRAFALVGDAAEVKIVSDLCARRCCDERGNGVRDGAVQPSGESSMQAYRALKTNILMLKDASKAVAGLLRGKRVYASPSTPVRYRDPVGTMHTASAWNLDPRILVFEYKFGYLLRQRQYDLVYELETEAREGRSRCNQMIMGAGKTTVIGPLLAMM
eukprot:SAG11_NODE_68_length_18649_cov_29.058005_3_plen_527_part_00